MADELEVNTEGLDRAASAMRELGAKIAAMGREVQANAEALGTPWGNGATGKKFMDQYQTPRDQLFQGTADLATAVGGSGDSLTETSQNFKLVEAQNTAAARGLVSSPDGSSGGSGTASGPLSAEPLGIERPRVSLVPGEAVGRSDAVMGTPAGEVIEGTRGADGTALGSMSVQSPSPADGRQFATPGEE
jgi:uncharacterized protein YukE